MVLLLRKLHRFLSTSCFHGGVGTQETEGWLYPLDDVPLLLLLLMIMFFVLGKLSMSYGENGGTLVGDGGRLTRRETAAESTVD